MLRQLKQAVSGFLGDAEEEEEEENSFGGISLEYTYKDLAAATNDFSPENKLGAGAAGAVFRGYLRAGTEVAVKQLVASPGQLNGFEDELRVLSRFRHPNLVTLLGFGQHNEDRKIKYLVYELLPGGDVEKRLKKAREGRQPFPWHHRVSVAMDASCGLSYMVNSQPKAFHRDIKPPNILLDANGTAKMADFGLAGTVKQKGKGHLTVEEISGTPGYADPQYIQSGRVTEASEVYSFGTVLLELLMNERPALCGPKGDIIYPLVQVVQPGAPGALERILGRLDAQASWPRPPVEELSELALRCVSTRGRPAFEEVVETLRRLYHASAAGANQAGQWTPSQWQQHSPQPQPQPQQQQQSPGSDGDPEKYAPGTEVVIGAFRFRCSGVLGRGSFSEVWAGDVLSGLERREVALKDITCQSKADLQQALLEASLLERFQGVAAGAAQGQAAMRIPRYLAHRVDRRRNGWRVRMAMTRVPGESLDAFLRRPPPPGQDGPSSVRRGCALASQLIRQLGPTLERIAPHAWHRDVNSHNVLMSDAVDGGRPRISADLEESARRASFWLIDFGLAVDSTTWPVAWPHADVAGDCRYWPPSSFLMSFYGPEEMMAHQDLCNQYKTRLDIVGLGLTALEILCTAALASSYAWGADGLRGSWRKLFTAWQRYREEVTRWHTMIFQVFSVGGDIGPLYQQLGQEHVVDKVTAHLAKVRSLLRACTQRTEDVGIQRLLGVLADMIDERSSLGLREAVEALGGPEAGQQQPPPPRPAPAQAASYVPPQVASYTPQPQAQIASYTPPVLSVQATPPRTTPGRVLAAPVRAGVAATGPCSEPEDLAVRRAVPAAILPQQTARPAAKAHVQDILAQAVGTSKGKVVPYARPLRPRFAGA